MLRTLAKWICLWGLLAFCMLAITTPAMAGPLTAAVDLRALPKSAYQQYQILPLYRKLLVRLTEAGFAVVGPQHTSQVRIVLKAQAGGLRVVVRGGGKVLQRDVPKSQDTLAQYHLEVLHKSLTAARLVQASVKAKLAIAARKKPVARAKGNVGNQRTLPPRPPSRWRAEIDLGGFLHYRIQAADFLARLGFRWGQERGFGLYSSLSLSPSISDTITIIEWGLQVGPTWRQPIVDAFSLEFGLLLGFVHHRYFFGQDGATQGNRWDFVSDLLLLGNWQIARSVGFRVWLSVGLSFQNRVHHINDVVIWERSLIRFGAGGAFYLSF